MIHIFGPTGASLVAPGNESALSSSYVWIDCYQPTREEEQLIENTLGIEIPTRAEMMEIEVSNRLYEVGPVKYMTTTLVSRGHSNQPEAGPVTFILTPTHLVTLRYAEYMSFRTFIAEYQKNPIVYQSADKVISGLMESVVERLADLLEKVGLDIEELSIDIFRQGQQQAQGLTQAPLPVAKNNNKKGIKPATLRELLARVGSCGNMDSKVRESLVSLLRMLSYMESRIGGWSEEARQELQSVRSDAQSLTDHSHFLADKITFLLDATLGLINIEQNDIIRIFSIGAVMFMPPTVIASIYGMNFHNLPELHWEYGYLYAIMLMLLSTLLPLLFFKKKGWL